jgi:nucleolar protein 12
MSVPDLGSLFDEPVRQSSRAPSKEIQAALLARPTAQSDFALKKKKQKQQQKARADGDDDNDDDAESYVEDDMDGQVVVGASGSEKKRRARDDEAGDELADLSDDDDEADATEDDDDDDDDDANPLKKPGRGADEATLSKYREEKLARKAALKAKKAQMRRTVFVGNVNVAARANHVKAVFSAYGKVEAVYFRSVAFKKINLNRAINAKHGALHPDRKSKNAYVVMGDEAQMKAALAANGTVLQGLTLRVDRPDQPKTAPSRTVFVGNLPFTVEDEDVRRHFAPCGPIEGVRCIRDPQTNMGKGIAYVMFEHVNSMPAALALNGAQFQERALRVDKALAEVRQTNGVFKKTLSNHPELGAKSNSYRVKKFVQKVQTKSGGVDKSKVHKELAGLNAVIAHATGKPKRKERDDGDVKAKKKKRT